MRYVKLCNTGEGSLSTTDARRFVTVAKTQSGNRVGEVMMTAPDKAGTYFVAFANHAHATHFIEVARPRGVRLESLLELPTGITLRRAPQQPRRPGSGSVDEEVLTIVLVGAAEVLSALFGKPGGGPGRRSGGR